jgi:hypothetical protein
MKQSITTLSRILIICLPLAAFIGVRIISTYIFTVKRHAFTFDSYLAPSVGASIEHLVRSDPAVIKQSYKQLCDRLQKEFPCIDTIKVQFVAPGTLHLDISTAQPLLAINNTHIVTAAQTLISRTFFYPYHTQFLPSITVTSQALEDPYQKSELATSAPSMSRICKNYAVQWLDSTRIILTHKEYPAFSVLCSSTTLPHDTLLAECHKLEQKHAQALGTGPGNKTPKTYVADVRFNKQIIMFSTQGGTVYG